MIRIKRERKWMAAGILTVALSAFALTGCFLTVGNHMNWQQVEQPGHWQAMPEARNGTPIVS